MRIAPILARKSLALISGAMVALLALELGLELLAARTTRAALEYRRTHLAQWHNEVDAGDATVRTRAPNASDTGLFARAVERQLRLLGHPRDQVVVSREGLATRVWFRSGSDPPLWVTQSHPIASIPSTLALATTGVLALLAAAAALCPIWCRLLARSGQPAWQQAPSRDPAWADAAGMLPADGGGARTRVAIQTLREILRHRRFIYDLATQELEAELDALEAALAAPGATPNQR